jgi:hypothetical protein
VPRTDWCHARPVHIAVSLSVPLYNALYHRGQPDLARMDDEAWGLREVVAYVLERGYKRVTLQFPDDLLEEAPAVAKALQAELSSVCDAKVSGMDPGFAPGRRGPMRRAGYVTAAAQPSRAGERRSSRERRRPPLCPTPRPARCTCLLTRHTTP